MRASWLIQQRVRDASEGDKSRCDFLINALEVMYGDGGVKN